MPVIERAFYTRKSKQEAVLTTEAQSKATETQRKLFNSLCNLCVISVSLWLISPATLTDDMPLPLIHFASRAPRTQHERRAARKREPRQQTQPG